AHSAPHRRRFRRRIAGRQQQLRLMRLQRLGCFAPLRPPPKAPFRQPLLRQPEALAVVKCAAAHFMTWTKPLRGIRVTRTTHRPTEDLLGSVTPLFWLGFYALRCESMELLLAAHSISQRSLS